MNLQQPQNTALTAPQLSNVNDTLNAYRSWKGFDWLTLDDLYQFMSVPTAERDEFLGKLSSTTTFVRTDFASKYYE